MHDYGHSILFGSDNNYLKCVIDAMLRGFKCCFNVIHRGTCVVALVHVVMTISGSFSQPLLAILSISGLYFLFNGL